MGSQLELYIAVQRKDNDDICKNYHLGNENSVAAHKSVIPTAAKVRISIFEYIVSRGELGATCDEVEFATGFSHQSCSARCAELKADGLVYEEGARPTRTGRRAAVLKAAK